LLKSDCEFVSFLDSLEGSVLPSSRLARLDFRSSCSLLSIL